MFAINHAATALIIKKKFPSVSMIWLLISVQFIEIIWVLLNFIGVEKTTTDSTVASVTNIHLSHMPISHSIFTTIIFSAGAWLIINYILKKKKPALAVALGIASHLILDLFTHASDIAVIPFSRMAKIGLGIYSIPFAGFLIETLYGLFCWFYYKGSKKLLGIILLFNIFDLTFFTAAIIGPEKFLAGNPMLIVTLILFQIVITLFLVGKFSIESGKKIFQPNPPFQANMNK